MACERALEARVVLGLELAQHVEIMEEPPGRLVEARDLAAIEDDGLERGERPAELAELAVAGDLDPEREPLAAVAARLSTASLRSPGEPVPEFRPWTLLPSTHNVASLWLVKRRSTRSPAHVSGTVAATSSQYVLQAGPSCSPSSTSR